MAATTKQPSKSSTTVRLSEHSYHWLREMATQSGESMQMVLDKAIEQYRRQRFWEELNVAYAALQQDAPAWADYQAELALWETTLMDGLDPNEVWTDADVVHSSD